MMPTIFIGHGSPMNAIEVNSYTLGLRELGSKIPRPQGIIMISAHWYGKDLKVSGVNNPSTIYDFSGFPKELYQVNYPAPGMPEMAHRITNSLLLDFNAKLDNSWGLDHGAWSILTHLYPNHDIPVLQISIDITKPFSFHFEIGKKLKLLRDEGYLIIGSGNIVHNLSKINWTSGSPIYPWATQFDKLVKENILEKNFNFLLEHILDSPEAKLSVPTLEHFLPLYYVLGATTQKDKCEVLFEEIQLGSISMTSYLFN